MELYDPFTTVDARDQMLTEHAAMTLFELNTRVRAVLQHGMSDTYRIVAELSDVKVASTGHCYVELVQKDTYGGSIIAKARGIIWRNAYVRLSATFESVTGRPLASGMKVLFEVAVSMSELYGYSLNIVGVDPTYTVGDMVKQRQAIIKQLEADGVIDLNKQLPLPRLIQRIAVISSEQAAGYGDFCQQLAQSGYDFHLQLFPAMMQGDQVESTIVDALEQIAYEADQWDVVVIIRGGGATTDLNGFESYLLAACVAQFPLPVLTGIGHERDDTVVDLVAHTRLKTPTAVAAFLIDSRSHEAQHLADLQHRLYRAANQCLQRDCKRLDDCSNALHYHALQVTYAAHHRLTQLSHRLQSAATRFVLHRQAAVGRQASQVQLQAQQQLLQQRHSLTLLQQRLDRAPLALIQQQHVRLQHCAGVVRLADPVRALSLGFSLTLKDGVAVRNASSLCPGDVLVTHFEHGRVESTVSAVSLSDQSSTQ